MHSARELTTSLGGHWHGRYGTAPCPICQPERHQRQNALTLSEALDQKLLVHCKKAGCSFQDLAKALGLVPGNFKRANAAELARAEAQARAEAEKRARQALALWREALPIRGTPAEVYLRGRNLDCASVQDLRFHPAAWHGPSARRFPAMLGFVKGGALPALHRTWIKPDGSGKANLDPNKAMLGPVKGGAVRLLDGPGPLVVAEGIETALSLACGLLPWPMRLWSALSASGMAGLSLPDRPGSLIIASDGDAAGRTAATALATRAFTLGWRVRLMQAPDGLDWNDVLMQKGGQ